MALFKSFLLSSVSGSVNGTTFARNASGMYMRNKTMPVNPNTELQVSTRAGFTNAANNWRTLSDAQQAAWKTYAQNTPTQNRVGDTIHLSGFGQYMALNGFLTYLEESIVANAPIVFGTATAITSMSVVLDDSAGDITISAVPGGSSDANAIYGIWISNPIGTGQQFYKGPWNYLGKETGVTITTAVLTPPFEIVTGQQYFIKVRYVDEDHRLSPTFQTGKLTVVA